jgi:hypothetical protein
MQPDASPSGHIAPIPMAVLSYIHEEFATVLGSEKLHNA